MKRFVCFLLFLFCATAHGDTVNIDWVVDNNTYTQTTCESGDDLILPNPPQKTGYTFRGWRISQYIPIEYIESTGTQWIDTGVFATATTTIKIQFSSTQTTGNNSLFGARTAYKRDSFSVWLYGTSGFRVDIDSNLFLYSVLQNNTIYTLEILKDKILLNNQQLFTYDNQNYVYPSYTMFLFKINQQATPANESGTKKIYYFKIYDNNVLVRDFIPVIDENGTPCLFDKVENKFYYNSGTDDFIAGPIIYQ